MKVMVNIRALRLYNVCTLSSQCPAAEGHDTLYARIVCRRTLRTSYVGSLFASQFVAGIASRYSYGSRNARTGAETSFLVGIMVLVGPSVAGLQEGPHSLRPGPCELKGPDARRRIPKSSK